MPQEKIEIVLTLFDDESVKRKLTVMSKWEAMNDDARNPHSDMADRVEALVQFGKTYKFTLTVEEVAE